MEEVIMHDYDRVKILYYVTKGLRENNLSIYDLVYQEECLTPDGIVFYNGLVCPLWETPDEEMPCVNSIPFCRSLRPISMEMENNDRLVLTDLKAGWVNVKNGLSEGIKRFNKDWSMDTMSNLEIIYLKN